MTRVEFLAALQAKGVFTRRDAFNAFDHALYNFHSFWSYARKRGIIVVVETGESRHHGNTYQVDPNFLLGSSAGPLTNRQ